MRRAAALCWLLLASTAAARQTDLDAAWRGCRTGDVESRIEACRRVLDTATLTTQERASAHYARGLAFRQKGLFTLALDDFNAAIAANASLADAYGERGITLLVLGRYTDAIPDFTHVIDAQPKLAYAYYNRGLCYELIGLDDLAIEDISAAIDLEPRAEFRYERRATIYFRKQQLDKALEDYERAIAINPQYAPALFGRGTIRVKTGDLAGGSADLATAKHFRPTIEAEMRRAGVK